MKGAVVRECNKHREADEENEVRGGGCLGRAPQKMGRARNSPTPAAVILHSLGCPTWSIFVLRLCAMSAGCARPHSSAAALGFPLSRLSSQRSEILGFAMKLLKTEPCFHLSCS